MTSAVNKLNTLVSTFITDNAGAENLEELWLDEEVQKKVRALLSSGRALHKKKDPSAPKRAKSAYLYFCATHRENVKKKLGPDAKATLITSTLGADWHTLVNNAKSGNKKAISELEGYNNQAASDKARYETEKANYVPSELPEVEAKGGRRKKAPKTGPKKSKSSYLYFCEEMRPVIKQEHPDMGATAITAELGVRWKALKAQGDAATKKYTDLAAGDKLRYENEKEGAKPTPSKSPAKPAPSKSSAKGKASKVEEPELEEEEEVVTTKSVQPKTPSKSQPPKSSAKPAPSKSSGPQAGKGKGGKK